MNELAKRDCVPCRGGVDPLKGAELDELRAELGASWQLIDEHHLEKEFEFKDFKQALAFTNRLGAIAEYYSTTL